MERARVRFYSPPPLIPMLALVFNPSKSIRQSEAPWSQPCRHSAGKPFAHEINCRLAVVPDVGANIHKLMCVYRYQKQFDDYASSTCRYSTHRDANEGDIASSY